MVGCLLSLRADDLATYLCSVFVHMLHIHYCKRSQKPIICSWLCPLLIRLLNRTWNCFLPQDPRLLRRVGMRSSFTEPGYDGGWWRQDRNRSERPLVPLPNPPPLHHCVHPPDPGHPCAKFFLIPKMHVGMNLPSILFFSFPYTLSPPFHTVPVLSSLYSHLLGSGLK